LRACAKGVGRRSERALDKCPKTKPKIMKKEKGKTVGMRRGLKGPWTSAPKQNQKKRKMKDRWCGVEV
jgi:hypothetical protein